MNASSRTAPTPSPPPMPAAGVAALQPQSQLHRAQSLPAAEAPVPASMPAATILCAASEEPSGGACVAVKESVV